VDVIPSGRKMFSSAKARIDFRDTRSTIC